MNEIKKMQTPWDSDKILMVDIGCYERGCVCVANQWDANYKSECVPMVEYKEWVGLTDDQMRAIAEWQISAHRPLIDVIKAVEQALKDKNI